MSDCTGCQNLSNLTYQGTSEICQIVQDVRTCPIWHTKGPVKYVRYRFYCIYDIKDCKIWTKITKVKLSKSNFTFIISLISNKKNLSSHLNCWMEILTCMRLFLFSQISIQALWIWFPLWIIWRILIWSYRYRWTVSVVMVSMFISSAVDHHPGFDFRLG
jgi:hypothetical protein